MIIESGLPQVDKHKVVVLTITYNHSLYIEETLKGFAMQQTDFPFLCCVFDDASTDGEQEVLKKWIENHCNPNEIEVYDHPLTIILKAPDKANSNCVYVFHLQKVNTWNKPEKQELISHWEKQCEYEAICEGDDYWIDPFKLQKQVDFLDKNPEYGLVHSNFKVYKESDGTFLNDGSSRYKIYNGNVLAELFRGCWIKTLTVCFRVTAIKDFPELPKGAFKGDIALFYEIAAKSKIYFFKEEMGVYRVLRESASHFQEETSRKDFADSLRITDYFALEHYNQTHLKEMVDLKWVISDIKYSLRAGNYKYFKSIKNINALRINKKYFLFLICMICRFKSFFYTLSFLLREKNVLNNKYNKRAF